MANYTYEFQLFNYLSFCICVSKYDELLRRIGQQMFALLRPKFRRKYVCPNKIILLNCAAKSNIPRVKFNSNCCFDIVTIFLLNQYQPICHTCLGPTIGLIIITPSPLRSSIVIVNRDTIRTPHNLMERTITFKFNHN